METIKFDDFKKIDLRIGRINPAERIEGSEKLVKLSVTLGDETRQIVAGVGTRYLPEELLGKQIVVVANLTSRTLMGVESQRMLLAANHEGPVLLAPDREVPPGSEIR